MIHKVQLTILRDGSAAVDALRTGPLDPVAYVFPCKSPEIPYMAGLMDVHSTQALSKVRVSSGKNTATASICPWCGRASHNE